MENKLKIIVENCPQNHKCPAVQVCPVGALTQKEFEAPKNINSYTQSAIVLKKIDALFGYKPTDKSILFAHELNRTLLKCYRHAYLNGNRSLF